MLKFSQHVVTEDAGTKLFRTRITRAEQHQCFWRQGTSVVIRTKNPQHNVGG